MSRKSHSAFSLDGQNIERKYEGLASSEDEATILRHGDGVSSHRLFAENLFGHEYQTAIGLGSPVDTFAPTQVQESCYYLVGDWRTSSFDSRYFGCVPKDSILGKARYIVWPKEITGTFRWERLGKKL